MLDLLLKFKSRPFSINKANYRNGSRTRENRAWADSIHTQMTEPEIMDQIIKFKKNIPKYPLFHVTIFHLHPSFKFYTASQDVHLQTMDLTNIEKGLVDLIFDKRYCGRFTKSGDRIETLENNDKRIIGLESYKGISENQENEIVVYIQLVPDLSLVRDRLNSVHMKRDYNSNLLSPLGSPQGSDHEPKPE